MDESFVDKLRHAIGNDKAYVIGKLSPNEQRCFHYAYDTKYVFRMKFKTEEIQQVEFMSENKMNDMLVLLHNIATHKIKGKSAKNSVLNFAWQHGGLIQLIINKDLDCGVNALTFNKHTLGVVIPTFQIQKAKELPLEKVSFPRYVEPKYDGVRVRFTVTATETFMQSSSGKLVHLPALSLLFVPLQKALGRTSQLVFDGELVYKTGKMAHRTSISGKLTSAMYGKMVDTTDMVFKMFDLFGTGIQEKGFEKRRMLLETFYKQHFKDTSHIQLCPSLYVDNKEEVAVIYADILKQGYEGLILKKPAHVLTFGRSDDWVKMKETKTADLHCTNWQEGEGKYSGQIGALFLSGICEGKEVEVEVGSGLKDSDRQKDFLETYHNKVIEVKYNSVIPAKDGGYTLFLARYVMIREDLS